MRKILITILLLGLLSARADTIPIDYRLSLSGGAIMPDGKVDVMLGQKNQWTPSVGAELAVSFHPEWQALRDWNNAAIGVALSYWKLDATRNGDKDLLGHAIAPYVFLEVPFYKSKHFEIGVRPGIGCSFVFQAFDVGAFNYIVKPIDDGKFSDVLHRAVDEWSSQNINEKEPEERYVLINNSGVHTKVILDEIVYAEVFNRKVVIHKLDGEIEYYGKMSDLESLAGDSFFRPHRAYLINFKYVEKYDATTIYLERGTVLMAKQNYPEFVKNYMKYIQKRG